MPGCITKEHGVCKHSKILKIIESEFVFDRKQLILTSFDILHKFILKIWDYTNLWKQWICSWNRRHVPAFQIVFDTLRLEFGSFYVCSQCFYILHLFYLFTFETQVVVFVLFFFKNIFVLINRIFWMIILLSSNHFKASISYYFVKVSNCHVQCFRCF